MRSTAQRDALDAIREGDDFFAQLACKDLTLEGRAQSDQSIGILGGALVWDRCGNFSGAILPPTGLPGGDKVYTVTVENNVVGGDITVFFLPTGVDFTESLLGAATGKCLSGEPQFQFQRAADSLAGSTVARHLRRPARATSRLTPAASARSTRARDRPEAPGNNRSTKGRDEMARLIMILSTSLLLASTVEAQEPTEAMEITGEAADSGAADAVVEPAVVEEASVGEVSLAYEDQTPP